MAPSLSLPVEEQDYLLDIARRCLIAAVDDGHPYDVDVDSCPQALRTPAATFVTLTEGGELRGCVGSLEPQRPLAVDVARNAERAALADRRFRPVTADELEAIDVKISILSPLEPIVAGSFDDLVGQLEPDIDGLVLADGDRRATFLPAVWSMLPDPGDFVRHLQAKAGLEPGTLSPATTLHRYRSIEISSELRSSPGAGGCSWT